MADKLGRGYEKGELEKSYKRYLTLMSEVERNDSQTIPRIMHDEDNSLPPNVSIKHLHYHGVNSGDESTPLCKYFFIFLLISTLSAAVTASIVLMPEGNLQKLKSSLKRFNEETKIKPAEASKRHTKSNNMRHVLLAIPGSGPSSSVESLCGKYINNFIKEKSNKNQNILLVDSLCDYMDTTTFQLHPEVSLSIVVHNPIQRVVQSFFDRQDIDNIYYDENFVGLSFDEFVNTTLMGNDDFTRALTCTESKSFITPADFQAAKNILSHNFLLSTQKYQDPIKYYLSNLPQYEIHCGNDDSDRRLQIPKRTYVPSLVNKHYKQLKEHNKLDVSLYSYFLKDLQEGEMKIKSNGV